MEPYLGQIMMFGGNFAIRGWAECDGQLLPISSNSSLFSILGTTYGGDGRTTFGLPDLRGRSAMHTGTGPGLTARPLGQKAGGEGFTITANQMPQHRHTLAVTDASGTGFNPKDAVLAKGATPAFATASDGSTMKADVISNTGGGQQLKAQSPYQVVTFLIALQGVYPSRN